MSESGDSNKIWSRFVSKKKDGSILKLRIQSHKLEPKDAVYQFLTKYYIVEEAIHKAAGVAMNPEAIKEYENITTQFYTMTPTHATICCVDNDSNAVEQILGVSIMQLTKSSDKFEEYLEYLDYKTEEMKKIFDAIKVFEKHFSGDKMNYDTFYDGRGVIVHPDYRKLGIGNEFLRVRKLICIEENVPMTCALMTALGTQKGAEKNNWKTFSEITVTELEEKTGLTYDKGVSSYKLMYTTKD